MNGWDNYKSEIQASFLHILFAAPHFPESKQAHAGIGEHPEQLLIKTPPAIGTKRESAVSWKPMSAPKSPLCKGLSSLEFLQEETLQDPYPKPCTR